MSKKKLQVSGIVNELEGVSRYFNPPSSPPASNPLSGKPLSAPSSEKKVQEDNLKVDQNSDRLSEPAINQAITKASKHASTDTSKPIESQNDIVETIRKTVKNMGKEVSFIRLTPDEKHELSAIVYTFNELYRGQGRKTSAEHL